MAYSEKLAGRVRNIFAQDPWAKEGLSEKKMFGGLAFLHQGNMCCGIVGNELMVRVGPGQYNHCLSFPDAREMDFTGRAMKGMVYVGHEGVAQDSELAKWVEFGLKFMETLPPKVK